MGQLGLEVADVFRRYGEAFVASLSRAQQRVMTASCAEPPRLVSTSRSAIN
jgi:hypothetical protein